jgi:hypothetical protein
MKRTATLVGAILLAVALAGALRPLLMAQDPTLTPVSSDVRVLKQSPEKLVGVTVRFEGMFHALENLWAPFFTPFLREDYLVFSIWPQDAEVWTKTGRLDDLPTCFLRKDSKLIKTLMALKPYAPVEVTGTVLSDFHKMPWIEIHSIVVTGPPRYTADDIRGLIRANPPEADATPVPAPGKPAAPAATPPPPAAASAAIQSRVMELEKVLASKQTETSDLLRQIETVKVENAQINRRLVEMDKVHIDSEKALQESDRSVAAMRMKNDVLAKRVNDLESMLRRIFGSVEAATEKLKEVEKSKGGDKATGADAKPASAPAPAQARAE